LLWIENDNRRGGFGPAGRTVPAGAFTVCFRSSDELVLYQEYLRICRQPTRAKRCEIRVGHTNLGGNDMRLAMVSGNEGPTTAIISADGQARGYPLRHPSNPGSIDQVLRDGRTCASLNEAMGRLRDAPLLDPGSYTFLPPLTQSRKIICVGLNYVDHAKESNFKVPDYPAVFSRFTSSLVGHECPIVSPTISDSLDYEGELVAVVGRTGHHIPLNEALSYVVGYSIFNDGSVREYQFKSAQWTIGKNFDGTGAFGPYLVTADEVPSGAKGLKIETRLNDSIVQSANTGDMIFGVDRLVSIISEAITLEAGDVIVTGTPAGVGFARSPQLFMKPGDVCEIEIEGIGLLRNLIVSDLRS
jgi:acylpyruvate hydrolase